MILSSYAPLVKRAELDSANGLAERRQRELLLQARTGNSNAFARLFDLYADRVYQYMYFHLENAQSAEDLTARVFLKAWNGIRCYRPEHTPFSVWVYLLARREMTNFAGNMRNNTLPKEILTPADDGLSAFELQEPCSEQI